MVRRNFIEVELDSCSVFCPCHLKSSLQRGQSFPKFVTGLISCLLLLFCC